MSANQARKFSLSDELQHFLHYLRRFLHIDTSHFQLSGLWGRGRCEFKDTLRAGSSIGRIFCRIDILFPRISENE
jgi:hypothetical protein